MSAPTPDPARRAPTRRELLRPVQLLGLAVGAAVFSGVVTLVAMGFFQQRYPEQSPHALMVALVVAGIAFIVTLVTIALLMLAVDPAKLTATVSEPVLRAPTPRKPPRGSDAPPRE